MNRPEQQGTDDENEKVHAECDSFHETKSVKFIICLEAQGLGPWEKTLTLLLGPVMPCLHLKTNNYNLNPCIQCLAPCT
jgi:hypothetical protein